MDKSSSNKVEPFVIHKRVNYLKAQIITKFVIFPLRSILIHDFKK